MAAEGCGGCLHPLEGRLGLLIYFGLCCQEVRQQGNGDSSAQLHECTPHGLCVADY